MEHDSTNVELAPSIDTEALRLLDTDPAAYFAATHKRMPVGWPIPEG